MKKLFSVTVKEVYVREVEVKANSEFEARQLAKILLDTAQSTAESFYSYDLPTEEWAVEVLPDKPLNNSVSLINTQRLIVPGEAAAKLLKTADKK